VWGITSQAPKDLPTQAFFKSQLIIESTLGNDCGADFFRNLQSGAKKIAHLFSPQSKPSEFRGPALPGERYTSQVENMYI